MSIMKITELIEVLDEIEDEEEDEDDPFLVVKIRAAQGIIWKVVVNVKKGEA
jgi:hypothetical protein